MEVNVESRHGFQVIVEAENVKMSEDKREEFYLKYRENERF